MTIIKKVFSPGYMKPLFCSFEDRAEQRRMAEIIYKGFEDQTINCIEAGTGTGKSLAYLLPAMVWALEFGEQVIISTNTIALQEQLLSKDIPLALKLLGKNLKIVRAIGRSNYICLRKVNSLLSEASIFFKNQGEKLIQWCQSTETGCRSDLSFPVDQADWEDICVDKESCSGCPYSESCFFLRVRRQIEEAHIVVANHYLVCADLIMKEERESGVFPPIKRIIFDEAHHFEDVATESFSQRISRAYFRQYLKGCLIEPIQIEWKKLQHILSPKAKKWYTEVRTAARDFLRTMDEFFAGIDEISQFSEKIRIKSEHRSTPLFQKIATNIVSRLVESGMRLISVWKDFTEFSNPSFKAWKENEEIRLQRFAEGLNTVQQFFDPSEEQVYWIEPEGTLVQAAVDISKDLQQLLFSKVRTAVLCSATLTSAGSFSYFRSCLGLEGKNVTENIFPSHFDYRQNVLFLVPTALPSPSSAEYQEQLPDICVPLVEASKGGVLILFTSYGSLMDVYKRSGPILQEKGYEVICQGEQSRKLTVERFRDEEDSVLFATSSFWEGIDVPGRALRSVIITRLPFDVPSEPLFEARSELVQQKGKNPFVHFSVPRATLRFHQAFGRLIRRKDDRGCVICLDNRLLTKGYGKLFVKSIPECTMCSKPLRETLEIVENFFTKV